MVLNNILLHYLMASLIASVFILILCIATPFINKVYTAKTKYYIWLMIAIYLVAPIKIPLLEEPIEVSVSNTVMVYTNTIREESQIIWKNNQENGADLQISEESLKDKELTIEYFADWVPLVRS